MVESQFVYYVVVLVFLLPYYNAFVAIVIIQIEAIINIVFVYHNINMVK